MVDPVSATGVAIAALALAHQLLKSSSVSKKDKKQIEASAKQLVELAQMSDIDKEARKSKRSIRYWAKLRAPAQKTRKTPRLKKRVAKRKKVR